MEDGWIRTNEPSQVLECGRGFESTMSDIEWTLSFDASFNFTTSSGQTQLNDKTDLLVNKL